MIVKRVWLQTSTRYRGGVCGTASWYRHGWYLFGFIPLYVRDITDRNALMAGDML